MSRVHPRVVRGIGVIAVVAALGCSSSSNGGGGGGGAGTGFGFDVKDAIAYDDSGTGYTELELKITDFAGECALEQANDSHKAGSTYAKIELRSTNGPIVPGDYAFMATAPASGSWLKEFETKTLDGTCADTSKATATGGTVTITAVGATVTGSYSITLDAGGQVSGTFSATMCNRTQSDGGSGTCQ